MATMEGDENVLNKKRDPGTEYPDIVKDEERGFSDGTSFLQPTRWWLASTAIPLLSVRNVLFNFGISSRLIN